MAENRKTRRVMSQIETIKMAKIMEQHIIQISTDPMTCEYRDGYDDEKVAAETGEGLSANHAYGLRRNIYGDLVDSTLAKVKDARIDLLEKKLGDALVILNEFIGKYDKLCMALSLARVGVDARHLVMAKRQGDLHD